VVEIEPAGGRSGGVVSGPARSEDPSGTGRRRPFLTVSGAGLILVCCGSVVVQSMLLPHGRPPGWDESVYLSQVTPGAEAAFFAGWRARGITILIAPAISAGASLGELRIYLIALSAVASGLSFSVWRPLVGTAVPIAAFFLSFSWIALLNGSQVMPNLWAALLGLAAAGFTIRRQEAGGARHAVLAAATLAATALVRPTEATVVFVVLATFVVLGPRRSWRMLGALSAGLAVGWAPWVVEMSVRFGGPLEALREAATGHVASAPIGRHVLRHLAYTDGELVETVVPVAGVLWWVALAVLSVLGIVRAATRAERAAAVVAAGTALAVIAEYVVFVPVSAPRFLLPAYAFAAIPASIGVVSLLRGRSLVRAVGVVVLSLAVPWAFWQASVADRVERSNSEVNGRLQEIGQLIRRRAAGDECSVMSPFGHPQIQIASGCAGSELPRPEGPSRRELERLWSGGASVFVIVTTPPPPTSPLAAVRPIRARGPNRVCFIYELRPPTARLVPGGAG